MITFKQYLTELFDNPYEITVVKSGIWSQSYSFTTHTGVKYFIYFEKEEAGGVTTWDVGFTSAEISPKTGRIVGSSLRGNGNPTEAARVYATVIKGIEMGIRKINFHSGMNLRFMPADLRTAKLYDKFANHIARKYNFWIKDTPDDFFTLVKG